jgi:uncharacterized protein YacL
MSGINQALLVMGSIAALAIAALVTCFVFAYPSILSALLFVLVAPVCAIFGLGFFKIAQDEFPKSKQANTRKIKEAAN